MAENGDGSLIRELVDLSYGRNDDGTFGPGLDLYFTIGATEQRYPNDVDFYLDRGDESWGLNDHVYWNNGYVELNYGLWPTGTATRSRARSASRARRRRRSSWRRPTTRRRPTAGRSASCAISATHG